MKLRIVMPTLGGSRWWAEAAGSAADISSSERVVVSPIEPPEEANARRWLRDESAGLYAAVNAGLRAPGDWMFGTYLNDDDRLLAEGIFAARSRMESDASVGAVFGRVWLINGDGKRLAQIPVARRGEDLGPLVAAGVVPLAQPGTVFRREMFEALGGFEASMRAAGDLEFFLRAWRAGWRFEFVEACVAEFRVHAAQLSQQAALVAEEKRRCVAAARGIADWRKQARGAKWRFRCANTGVYLDRWRRHGFASMDSLQRVEVER